MSKSNYQVNPLVQGLMKEMESSKSSTGHHLTSLDGYIGSKDNNNIRLYSDLQLGEYIDIPQSKIVKVNYESEKDEDVCTVIFYADCELKYVQTLEFKAMDVIQSNESRGTGSGNSCQCNSDTEVYRLDNSDVELPPMQCEIQCEMARNNCSEGGFWCSLRYHYCRISCNVTSRSNGLSRGIFRL